MTGSPDTSEAKKIYNGITTIQTKEKVTDGKKNLKDLSLKDTYMLPTMMGIQLSRNLKCKTNKTPGI